MVDVKTEILDVDEQIEEAKSSLERINGWINNCDSKAGIVFALVGVLLAIIFTSDGLMSIEGLLKEVLPPKSFCTVLYLIFFFGASVCLIYGMMHLIFALFAKIDAKVYSEQGLETNSVLFFGSISDRSSYQNFRSDILSMNKEEYLNDLFSQIYINSKIVNEKYKNYNKGIKWTITGFIAFIVIFLIGLYLY